MKNYILLFFIIFTLFGCKSHDIITEIPIEIPIVKTEYVSKIDSVYIHDSIYHEIIQINDTVFNTKFIYKDIYKIKNDTICKTDTITKPIYLTKTEIKETNKLKWYQKFLIIFGIIFIIEFILKLTK